MKKLTVDEIPGNIIFRNFFDRISYVDSFKLEEIKVYGYGDELDQIDIKLIVTRPVEKKPKKWLKKNYEYLSILLRCVNIESFHIEKFRKQNFSIDVHRDKKYFYLKIIYNSIEIFTAKSETIYFDRPEGLFQLE